MSDQTSPLHALHQSAEAEFQDYDGIEIVSTFGQPEAEYAALHKSAGLMDLPQQTLLEARGKDRGSFLDNLITNRVYDREAKGAIAPGAVRSFLLTVQGRVVADFCAVETGDAILLQLDRRLVDEVHKTIDKYLFAEDVKLTNLGKSHQLLALHGPGALKLLATACNNAAIAELGPNGYASATFNDMPVHLWREDMTPAPGIFMALPVEHSVTAWQALLALAGDELGKRAIWPVGWAAFNAARIEAGRPLMGVDFDNTLLPAETGLFDQAVSVTKGCYLGQEVVARMYARQQQARLITGIKMEGTGLPIAGSPVMDDGDNQVGVVTSSTISPKLSNACLCLALLKRPNFNPGARLRVPAEGEMAYGVVTPLPFISADNDGASSC